MSFYFTNSYERSLGTFPLKGKALEDATINAINVGYKSFDTAQMYQNEKDFGEILFKNKINRKNICITTKVDKSNYGSNFFLNSVEKSLKDLKTDYVDVLLVHWPDKHGKNDEALEGLQKAYDKGMTKNIGISNFTLSMMKDALKKLSVKPITNQVEFHPLLNISTLKEGSDKIGIPLSSYCSVARGEVFKDSTLNSLGKLYGKSAGQIALRWILQQGVSVNTMSTKYKNIKENFDILKFTLSGPDMNAINTCMRNNYRIVDKNIVSDCPEWD